ncbi:MAG: helix-turn-helix domain-containing protein [Myxococcota bacterium]
MARPRQISDDDILRAAREVFVDDGPAASTSKVAELLGVSQAALFRRFGSKERLLLEALAPPKTPRWVAEMAEGPDERPLVQQLTAIARSASDYLSAHVPRITALCASGISHDALFDHYAEGPPVVVALRALTSWVRRAQRRGLVVKGVDPRSVAVLFLGAVQFPAFLNHLPNADERPRIDQKTLEKTVALVARGLEP